MEEENVLEGKSPISDDDIAEIIRQIKKPDIVDEALFTSVVQDLMSKKLDFIRGVETDPLIKEALRQEEIRETERWASIQIKLTQETKNKSYYPSGRDEALPKFYTRSEIVVKMVNTVKEIEIEIGEIFGVEEPVTSSKEIHLSPKDVEEIVSLLDYKKYYKADRPNVQIDPYVAFYAGARLQADMRLQLARVKLFPERMPAFKAIIAQRFERSLALPGKWVGNIMAASFGESSTQQTLNTFHASGNKDARKQIQGFAKFESILEAAENPQHTNMIIFMRERHNGDQLRLKIPNIQMTVISDLVESHRIISSDVNISPQPRWELVNDLINNINYSVKDGKERKSIHRWNTYFAAPEPGFKSVNGSVVKSRGRILEIKFNVRELFFRKISLAQVAMAIEQTSRDIRVVTSSMDIGLIYVFFKFISMSTSIPVKGDAPDFTSEDPFGYALENSIYPNILHIQVGGITGIEYAAVQNYKVANAIDFYNSRMDKDDENKRVTIVFKENEVLFWAITEKVITEFIMLKLKRYLPAVGMTSSFDLMRTHYNLDTYEFSFNSVPLRWYDYKSSTYKLFTDFKQVEEMLTTETRVPVYELLNHINFPTVEVVTNPSDVTRRTNSNIGPSTIGSSFPVGLQPSLITEEMVQQLGSPIQPTSMDLMTNEVNLNNSLREDQTRENRSITRPVRMLEDSAGRGPVVIIEFNGFQLHGLGFDLKEIALALESAFSYDDHKVTSNVPSNQNSIYLIGVVPNPEIQAGLDNMSIDAFVEEQLKKIPLSSDIIEQYSLKWFYNVEGKGLSAVLSHPEVDPIHTRSDHIVEVYKVLGVEPCRSVLLKEITNNTSQNLNPVHVELLADSLTHRTPGDKPLAQNKHGLNRKGTEFTVRAFQTTTDVFMEAVGEINQLESFPSQIMMGLLDRTGNLAKEDRNQILKDRDIFKYDFPTVEGVPDGEMVELEDVPVERNIVLREVTKPESANGDEGNALDLRRQLKKSAPPARSQTAQKQKLVKSTPAMKMPSSGLL